MAKKGFRHFGTLGPAAQLTALAMLLTVSHVSADVLCNLSMTSSTTVPQQVSVEISCSGSASTSTQPHVWIDSSLNPLLTNLTGVSSSPAPSNNALGLVTFNGSDTLVFDSITTTNVQIPEESPLGSLVWFASEGNVTINSWTSSNSTCPGASLHGIINFDGTNTDFISLHNANALCSPVCLTISGASPSVEISNSTFQYDQNRPAVVKASTAAVWVNLTGTLTVTNSSFTEFNTSYGALSVHASNATISNCSFTRNIADHAGGALFITGTGRWGALGPQETPQGLNSIPAADSGWVWIKNSIFLGNSVDGKARGGALDIVNMGNILINGSKFDQNQAITPADGGTIHIMGTTLQHVNILINNTDITGGNASCNVLLESVGCVGLKDVVIQNNLGIGMCVHDVKGGCSFEDPIWTFGCGSEDGCGPMPLDFDSIGMPPNVSAEIPQFSQFSAYGSFTAIYDAAYASDKLDSSMSDTTSDAVQNTQDLCIDIRSSVFKNNTVKALNNSDPFLGGAGLEIQTAQLVLIAHSVFEDNVGAQGAGVHLDACPSTLIWSCSFDNNTATYEGGAIAHVNSNGQGVLLGASNLTHNSAASGGALFGNSGANLLIAYGTVMRGNTAMTGGAVHCDSCQQLTMTTGSTVDSNNAAEGGGACCLMCECVLFQDVHFLNNRADTAGGAVYVNSMGMTLRSVTLVWVKQSSFTQNQAGVSRDLALSLDGGAWSLDGSVNFFLNNTFDRNSAVGTGGAVAYNYQCFQGGRLRWDYLAPDLAALSQDCSTLTHSTNTFSSNFAEVAGGAIFSTDLRSSRLACTPDTPVSSNSLDCAAPLWLDNGVGPQGYGSGVAFPPARILVESDDFLSYGSDGKTQLPMQITIRDQGNTVVTSGSSPASSRQMRAALTVTSAANLGLLEQPQLHGQVEGSADAMGVITISSLTLTAAPGQYLINVTLPDYPQVPPALVPVTVRNCSKGEVQDSPTSCLLCPPATFSFFPNDTQCQSHCPDNADCPGGATMIPELGFWHSAPESMHMAECPNQQACMGDRLSLHACQTAAYAAPALNGSTQGMLATCELNTDVASQLATSYMRIQCSQGYYGPLCSMCLKEAEDGITYGRTTIWGCQRCKRGVAIVASFIASNLLVLAFLSYSIHAALKDNEEDLANIGSGVRSSEMARAFTLWLQYISLLGNANVPAPKTVSWLFTFSGFAFSSLSSGALSTDCLINPNGNLNPALKRIILRLSVPGIILAILLLLQLLRWFWQTKRKSASVTVLAASRPDHIPRSTSAVAQVQPPTHTLRSAFAQAQPTNHSPCSAFAQAQGPTSAAGVSTPVQQMSRSADLKRRSLVTLLVVAFYFYPNLVTDALSFFACFKVDPSSRGGDGSYAATAKATWAAGYWLSDMTVPCFTGAHMHWAGGIGLPFILLTGVGIPLALLSTLLYHRKRLDQLPVRMRYGFIYQPYRRHLWFWDPLVLLQTFGLAAAQVLATSLNGYYQLCIMLMIFVTGLTVLAHVSPFREAISQHVQVFSMFTVAVTATACLYFLDPAGTAKRAGMDAAGVLILILNALFLLTVAVLIVKAGGHKAVSEAQQMLSKACRAMQSLGGKIACCGRRGTFASSSSSISISMAARPAWERMNSGTLPDARQPSIDEIGMRPTSNRLSMQSGHSSFQSQNSSAALLP